MASFLFAASFEGARSLSSYVFKHSSNGVVKFGLLINAEVFSFERIDDLLNDEGIVCAHVNPSVATSIYHFV